MISVDVTIDQQTTHRPTLHRLRQLDLDLQLDVDLGEGSDLDLHSTVHYVLTLTSNLRLIADDDGDTNY